MTYDPIDTNETDTDADGSLTIDDLTATTVAGLDTSSGTGNRQIFTDGEGGLFARGYGPFELPVAYQNLVAWYPFDSARYGGSNADDVTAIIGGSGDDTAFDGTVNGATYQSSVGVTDINAGANSGAFDFDGSNDDIETNPDFGNFSDEYTFTFWFNTDGDLASNESIINVEAAGNDAASLRSVNFDLEWIHDEGGGNVKRIDLSPQPSGSWAFFAATWDGSTVRGYIDALERGLVSSSAFEAANDNSFVVFFGFRSFGPNHYDGQLDDVRFYNRALSQTEINQIYQNTEP